MGGTSFAAPLGTNPARPAISLGHFPAYLDFGARTGAQTVNIADEAWNTMDPEEQWFCIQGFLDRAMERGSEFRLATPLDAIRPGSFLERELQYLFENGFVPSPDGTMLVPGAPWEAGGPQLHQRATSSSG